jgi:predicted exporter
MDLGKSLINRFVAPSEFKPATIEQYAKMKESYPWVEAIARLMRPAIGLIVLATWATMHLQGIATQEVDNFASAVGFYLFGERSLFYIKKK